MFLFKGRLFNFDIEMEEFSDLKVEVFDVLGRLIMNKNFGQSLGGQFPIDLSDESNGIYMLKFQVGNQTLVRKIIVNK